MDNENVFHIYNEILFSSKVNLNMQINDWPRKYYIEWGNMDSERETIPVLSHLCFLAPNPQMKVYNKEWQENQENYKGTTGMVARTLNGNSRIEVTWSYKVLNNNLLFYFYLKSFDIYIYIYVYKHILKEVKNINLTMVFTGAIS